MGKPGITSPLLWEPTLGDWVVVTDASVRCYGGHPIVLRLWVSLVLFWATRRIGFGIVPDGRIVLRTLGTGCLAG